MFKKAEPAPKPKPTTLLGKTIALLPEDSNKMRALMFFGIGSLFLLLAMLNIFAIIISPAKFTCMFTIAVILAMIGLAEWTGPQKYVEKCLEKQYRIRTGTLFFSVMGAIFFSLIYKSWIMSAFFCILELNAVLLFFCNTFPIGRSAQSSMQNV